MGDLPDTRGGSKDVLIILAVLAACAVTGILFWASLKIDEPWLMYSLWFLGTLGWVFQLARGWNRRRQQSSS
jgi:hypothetical protein